MLFNHNTAECRNTNIRKRENAKNRMFGSSDFARSDFKRWGFTISNKSVRKPNIRFAFNLAIWA